MIGQALPRLEDRRLVLGNGQYTDDIKVEGQVYAAFMRSPHAHAVIKSINTAAALESPGVLAVARTIWTPAFRACSTSPTRPTPSTMRSRRLLIR